METHLGLAILKKKAVEKYFEINEIMKCQELALSVKHNPYMGAFSVSTYCEMGVCQMSLFFFF